MLRTFLLHTALAIMALAGLFTPRLASAADGELPSDKAGWISALSKLGPYLEVVASKTVIQQFLEADPELVYAVLHDGWGQISSVNAKNRLLSELVYGNNTTPILRQLSNPYKPNPHLIDIVALGIADESPSVRGAALQYISGIAFRRIKDQSDFEQWRKTVGDRSLIEAMDFSCRALLKDLETLPADQKPQALQTLSTITFSNGRFQSNDNGKITKGLITPGIVALRRKVAIDAGMIDVLAGRLGPENPAPVRERAVQVMAQIIPDEAALEKLEPVLKRELPPMLDSPTPYAALQLLSEIKSPWVTDLLLKRITELKPNNNIAAFMIINALSATGDLRAIPPLIALYDRAAPGDFLGNSIEQALSALTGNFPVFNSDHDGDWWRDWWQENKKRFPDAIQKLPIPKIAGVVRSEAFSLRRKSVLRQIGGDPHRTYWLISPGIVTPPSLAVHPGLLVVVCDPDDIDSQRRLWQNVSGRAWNSRYLIALINNPANENKNDRPASWPTQQAPYRAGGTSITVEDLTAAAVADVNALISLDPSHIFLHGEGSGGLAVYSCSLQKTTPFKGFFLLSSAFHSAQLPPLTQAKGRKYYLLHCRNDKTTPFFLTAAAETLLRKQGAAVKLSTYAGEHGYHFEGDTLEPFVQAMEWLESGEHKTALSKPGI